MKCIVHLHDRKITCMTPENTINILLGFSGLLITKVIMESAFCLNNAQRKRIRGYFSVEMTGIVLSHSLVTASTLFAFPGYAEAVQLSCAENRILSFQQHSCGYVSVGILWL